MASMPKRVKFRKSQRGKIKGNATRGNTVSFGQFGLMTPRAALDQRQADRGRPRGGQPLPPPRGRLFIRIFPHKPISSKPLEVRMGSGKGEPEFWAAVVKPGTVLFEVGGVDEPTAKKALARVAHKMPVKCKFVVRRHAVA